MKTLFENMNGPVLFMVLSMAFVFQFGQRASADVILADYNADAGVVNVAAGIENPGQQGWTELGAAGVTVTEGIIYNGTNAWRILDNDTGQNPRYTVNLTASDLQSMFENGWVLGATVKVNQEGQFFGWGLTLADDPGWGLTDRERVGFGVNVATGNAFKVSPIHGGASTLATDSADDFHTILCVGYAYSSSYDYYIDGVFEGTFDIKDGISNSSFDNICSFASGTTSGVGREAYWHYVSLVITENFGIFEIDGSTDVAEGGVGDSFDIGLLSSVPTDDVVVTLSPDIELDLGSGGGNAIVETFTSANPDDITINVNAVNDGVVEGDHTGTIMISFESDDPVYSGSVPLNLVVNVTDNTTGCGKAGTVYLVADINRDCYVNLLDIVKLAMEWMQCTDLTNPGLCDF